MKITLIGKSDIERSLTNIRLVLAGVDWNRGPLVVHLEHPDVASSEKIAAPKSGPSRTRIPNVDPRLVDKGDTVLVGNDRSNPFWEAAVVTEVTSPGHIYGTFLSNGKPCQAIFDDGAGDNRSGMLLYRTISKATIVKERTTSEEIIMHGRKKLWVEDDATPGTDGHTSLSYAYQKLFNESLPDKHEALVFQDLGDADVWLTNKACVYSSFPGNSKILELFPHEMPPAILPADDTLQSRIQEEVKKVLTQVADNLDAAIIRRNHELYDSELTQAALMQLVAGAVRDATKV